MAALNFYIVFQLATATIRLNYSIFCEPCRQVSTPDELQVSYIPNAFRNLDESFFGVLFCFTFVRPPNYCDDFPSPRWSTETEITCYSHVLFRARHREKNCSAKIMSRRNRYKVNMLRTNDMLCEVRLLRVLENVLEW